MKKEVQYIPATKSAPSSGQKRVGIYCRVSSSKKPQLKSLAQQISGLTRFVVKNKFHKNQYWSLTDIYVDIVPGSDSTRDQFDRMLSDARQGTINLVVVKSSSRLGRDTVEVIQACRDLSHFGCDIYFCDLDSLYSEIGAQTVEFAAAVDHDENENRRNNIRWGIRQGIQDGTSRIFDRVCYGYEHDEHGGLIMVEDQAIIVRRIFALYLSGASVLSIKRTLESEKIPAPRGGEQWSKKTIEGILGNLKYTGSPIVHTRGLTDTSPKSSSPSRFSELDWDVSYASIDNNPAIITKECFEKVQQQRMERSNIEFNADGTKKRKTTHYSSKRARSAT